MSVYIGLRDLASFYASLNMCGGTFENLDTRLTTVKDDIYLLTFAGQDYAVSKEFPTVMRKSIMTSTLICFRRCLPR